MRTFQHRLVVVLRAEGADTPEKATAVATAHCDFWNATHLNEETGFVPDVLADRLAAEGHCLPSRIRAPCACSSRSTCPGALREATASST